MVGAAMAAAPSIRADRQILFTLLIGDLHGTSGSETASSQVKRLGAQMSPARTRCNRGFIVAGLVAMTRAGLCTPWQHLDCGESDTWGLGNDESGQDSGGRGYGADPHDGGRYGRADRF